MMKNPYTLQALVRAELASREEEQRIYFQMRDAVVAGAPFEPIADLEALADVLQDASCYVAHNVVTWKGRTALVGGRTFLATAANVVAFLRGAMQADDVRPLLIAPCFSARPDRVVLVDEDQLGLYHVR
jgi:hypothetical protein